MQNPVGLHMAPIHRHFGAQKIRPDLKDSDTKGARQAIGEPGFYVFGSSGALPDRDPLADSKISINLYRTRLYFVIKRPWMTTASCDRGCVRGHSRFFHSSGSINMSVS